jgi:1-acyl-sn-glycerol-3-phosphate acyltransferase
MTLYQFAKRMFRFLFRIMGWKVRGVENFPKEGPVIMVSNHISLWDPIVAASGVPREVSYMAKEELFSIPVLGTIIRRLKTFPVRRGQGDTSAIRNSLAILKQDGVVGLFPEGTRSKSGELQKGLPGMVLLMEKSKAPIIPVKIYGTKSLLTRGWGNIEVIIGAPLTLEHLKAPEGVENRREWAALQVMNALNSLQP